MSLVTMPNGEVVDVPDDITPDGLKRIQANYSAKPAAQKPQASTRVDARQAGISRKARQLNEQSTGFGADLTRSVMKGLTFGTMDEIAGGAMAATQGVYRAIRDGDISQIGNTYRETRDVERERDRIAADRSPVQSTLGEIGGAVLNPIGTGARGLQAAAKGAEAVGLTRAAGALSKGGAKLANAGALTQGVAAGALQGSLNAAGNADELSDVPGAALGGAALGGVAGGALAGAGQLVGRGAQILKDARPENAERTAYSRIANLLDSGGTTANKVEREIAVTDARGGDGMVQDVLPSLRAQAGAISRKPSVSGSNDLIERGEQRIQDRRARFGDQVRDTADVPSIGDDALARADTLGATRKQNGQEGYKEGGIMDTPIQPTPNLQAYLKDAPEEVQGAMRGAYREMMLRDQSPGDFVGTDGVFTHIPNLRTFDYVKRSFDQQIGQAIRSGDKSTAQGLSYQLDKLKGVLAEANPNNAEYATLLKSQRDLFQKQNALEIGTNVLGRVGREPRLVMRDLKALEPHQVDDARVGILDALINADSKADPVAYYRSLTRNPAQREVMEFAFGGKGNLGRFDRWVNREVRGTRADVLTAPGRQSETARFAMADADAGEGAGNVLQSAMRGFAFGGVTGAVSGAVRKLGDIATGTSRVTQEEIAKILLSKGENLVKGTEAAAAYQKAREVGNRRRARMLGKAGQQIYTDQAGGQ